MPPKNKSKIYRFYKPFFTFTICLSILSSFALSRPQTTTQIYQQIQTRLQPTPTPPPPNTNYYVDSLRLEKELPSLISTESLNQAAEVILYDLLTHQKLTPTIKPEDAATLYGFNYKNITSFTALLPSDQDFTAFPDLNELVQDTTYTHIGIAQKQDTIDSVSGTVFVLILAQPQKKTTPVQTASTPSYYTGVELWQEIQKYRLEHGVPPFKQDNTLCTIASIRVNQLLELGKLDDHNGFNPLVEKYRDSNQLIHSDVAENILSGYLTAPEAVSGWDSSLGHRKLMQDGSYVYACAAANYGFAVLIAAF